MQPEAMPFDTAVTDLGNLAVVGPAAIVCCFWLLLRWDSSAALRFLCAAGMTFVAISGLKVISRLAGDSLIGTPFELSTGAPSGHMAMSVVVYGGMSVLLLRLNRSLMNVLAACLSVVILIGIGVTRVILHAHTPADVTVGLLIGGAVVHWLSRTTRRPPHYAAADHSAELLVLVIVTVVMMHLSGFRLDSAKFI